MKTIRWKRIMRAEGYKFIKEFNIWENKQRKTVILEEEIRKDNLLYWLACRECPVCEYCCGSTWENIDGWITGCTSCQATGIDYSNMKKIGKLED